MTVQMSTGDRQNVDPQLNNSAMPSSEDEVMDSSTIQSAPDGTDEPVTMEQSNQSCSQVHDHSAEQENSSHLSNADAGSGDVLPLPNGAPEENQLFVPANVNVNVLPIKFPEGELKEVEDTLAKPKWAISIIPCKEFEVLLDTSIEMMRNGQYESDQLCQHFVTDTIFQFYFKFYNDEIVESIKFEVLQSMNEFSFKIIEIIVMNFDKENFKLLDVLANMFTPTIYSSMSGIEKPSEDLFIYTKGHEYRFKRGQLMDMINYFGRLGGFDTLLSCFKQANLPIFLVYSYLKPFANCIDVLSQRTIETYFLPILQIVPNFIENLTDEELKKEAKNECKSDNISSIIKILRNLALRLPSYSEFAQTLELLRLKIILRLLQVSSFNGKMNALNELNRVITCCSTEAASVSTLNNQSEFLLTPEQMAQWLIENKVLDIVLKDCLHQPQYVEKLENIIRFLIKKNTLSLDYLDKIWDSQIEKHEIIVKNVHDLIAKMAWSFTSDQLNHLFVCFQSSWANASKKEREKLLELMRRLAEDDKDGSMAHKVLTLLWDIAYSDEVDIDIIDQALTAHFKILDYGRTYDKDTQKIMWLKKCIGELEKTESFNSILPAMKHIREICRSFPLPMNTNGNKGNKASCKTKCKVTDRYEVLSYLQEQYSFVALIATNLSGYMECTRKAYSTSDIPLDPNVVYDGRRFTHMQEVQERLNFLKFVLQEGQLWLCLSQANEIWDCLARNAICKEDTQMCFRWFTSLVSQNNETDLDPETFGQFFEMNILKLDHALVDINGIECFQKFFFVVNCQQSKIMLTNNKYYINDNDLIGLDYLWKLIYFCDDDAAQRAINLLIEVFTSLGPKLIESHVEMHVDLINSCFDRLRASYDTIIVIKDDPTHLALIKTELRKMTRVLSVLYEYINKCDNDFSQERSILPMSQSYRGKQISAHIKVLNFGRNTEEIHIWTHSNESLTAIRKRILTKLKMAHNVDVEFCIMGEKIDLASTKVVSHLNFADKLNMTARLMHSNTNISNSDIDFNAQKLLQKQENNLPGVIISQKTAYFAFLFQLADIGRSLNYFPLQEKCLSLLKIIPPDTSLVQFVKNLCKSANTSSDEEAFQAFENELFSSPTKTIYLFGVIYSLLLPTTNPMSQESQEFQLSFITSKCALRILNYLVVDESFLAKTDNFYKICAISIIMKISKFVLSTLAFLRMFSMKSEVVLNEILKVVPRDNILQKVCMGTAQNIHNLKNETLEVSNYGKLISSIIGIAFATATGSFEFLDSNTESLHQYFLSETIYSDESAPSSSVQIFDAYDVCRESTEILIILFMLSPGHLKQVINEKKSQNFFIDLLLICNDNSIRFTVMEQFTLIIKCVQNVDIVNSFINLLFKHLKTSVSKFYHKSCQFFQFFCNLLNYAYMANFRITALFELISYEINLLKNARQSIAHNGVLEEIQLEGHFKITKELVMLLSPEDKFKIGSNGIGQIGFIEFLTDECLFTASKSLYLLNNQISDIGEVDPVCTTSNTLVAAYELLVSLCTGCSENLLQVTTSLETYFSNMSISDFEYYPFMGTRPQQSFVGLKNAGATCYMNSVLQQLFMIPEIRNGILSVNTGPSYSFDDHSNDETCFPSNADENQDDVKTYNIGILKQLQIIFGHLLLSKCQYYVPRGFWRHFKLFGGPINLREQHDALEFFNSLVDSLDEALKSLNQIPIMSHVFGGTFADQKICKGCPHRYSREESFTTLNVDVRNHNSLNDSLEQYVKGDLLEGDNAYHCEKCDRKVDTVKRLCIKKLPKILAIQLKRFDYDYERESAIKFNDYFEFPRILDMQPYTVNGLAQIEGEVIEEDLSTKQADRTRYELNGIVVHSGQASGGHYYSFILDKSGQTPKWYKFDDGDVNEWKLDEDEEMRNQCFGGEYVGEVFDQMLKKMSHRTQKRWWNAFILVYRQINDDEAGNERPPIAVSMPLAIKKNAQHQNIRFLHQRNLFSEEFYYFMRRLIQCNHQSLNCATLDANQRDKIIYTTLNLAARFLFSFCFRTRRSLRNNAIDWYEDLIPYLKTSCAARLWFLEKHLLNNPNLFCEFLLECPAPDVRHAFAKIVVLFAHYALLDRDSVTASNSSSYANRIMSILVRLLKKEISDYSNHLSQFFLFFHSYAHLGAKERAHLLQYEVPYFFMLIATDEGPGYPIKYQYVDLNKLYQVVSILVRSCNTFDISQSSNNGQAPLPNPHRFDNQNYIIPIQDKVYETLFMKKKYLKKIIKEATSLEETVLLLKFCCWENASFSRTTLTELLYHICNVYTYELRPYFELLFHILILNDSWQQQRIRVAFIGDDQNADGLFDILTNHAVHLEKRAYQCIKFLVHLFHNCELALMILKNSADFKHKWLNAISWLSECLNYTAMPYQHNNWSSAHSNETSNSYALERSNSANITLTKAEEILTEEDLAGELEAGDNLGPEGDEGIDLANEATSSNNNETEEQLSSDIHQLNIDRTSDAQEKVVVVAAAAAEVPATATASNNQQQQQQQQPSNASNASDSLQ